jgi:hypothetical protein
MSADRAGALIRALGRAVGIDALCFDDGGTCTLSMDETVLALELDEGEDRLVLHAGLGSLRAEGQAELFARLLEGNLFWKATHGATLTLDHREDRALLMRVIPLNSPPAGFPGLVERFVDAAEAWREVIATAFGAVPEPAANTRFVDPCASPEPMGESPCPSIGAMHKAANRIEACRIMTDNIGATRPRRSSI